MAERLDLPAPVVTITDPAHPAAPVDVIGAEPRQLSPQRRHELWALAGVALLVAAGVWAAQHVAESHRLDRAAERELVLQVTGADPDPGTLSLMSVGRHPVTVLSIGLDVPHLPMMRTSPTSLLQGAPVPVRLPRAAACPPDATGSPSNLLVRVRTYRGQQRTLRLPLAGADDATTQVVYAMLAGCGSYAPEESLLIGKPRFAQLPALILVDVPVSNRDSVPRQLVYDSYLGGLGDVDAETKLLTLGPHTTVVVHLQLAVVDCTDAVGTWQRERTDGLFGDVTGSAGGGVQLLDYSEPTVDAWVGQQCVRARAGQP